MISPLFNIMKEYKSRNLPIRYIGGIINVNSNHYVSCFIHPEKKLICTCDPYPNPSKESVGNIRKWISKSMSFIDYFARCDDPKPEELYYGSDILKVDSFMPKDPHPPMTTLEKETIYYNTDISSDKKYTKQKDNYNCGIYTLW